MIRITVEHDDGAATRTLATYSLRTVEVNRWYEIQRTTPPGGPAHLFEMYQYADRSLESVLTDAILIVHLNETGTPMPKPGGE